MARALRDEEYGRYPFRIYSYMSDESRFDIYVATDLQYAIDPASMTPDRVRQVSGLNKRREEVGTSKGHMIGEKVTEEEAADRAWDILIEAVVPRLEEVDLEPKEN